MALEPLTCAWTMASWAHPSIDTEAEKALATKLSREITFAARWMKIREPVQLDLPFGGVEVSPIKPS